MTSIDIESRWMHQNQGYWVSIADLGDDAKVKDANDANWSNAVGYYREDEMENAGDSGGPIYIRSQADFLAKFTQSDETG